ncbi:hypothetical protein GGG16DRAFT_113816 [Schizophyllum commune]
MSSDHKSDANFDPLGRFMVARLGLGGMDNVLGITQKPTEERTFGTYRHEDERIQWNIHRMDEGLGYSIKNVEQGSYLGFQGTSFTSSKEPFAWTLEPHKKDDGVYRFTAPNTEVYVDFASEGGSHHSHQTEDRSGASFGEYGYQSYAAYRPSQYRK